MDKILFSRISENRDVHFLLSTSIIKRKDKMIVQKKAVTECSQQHLEHIYKNYGILREQYESDDFHVSDCEWNRNKLEFDFCVGSSLDKVLDQYLKDGNVKEALKEIEIYFSMIMKNSKKTDECAVNETIFPSAKASKFNDCYVELNIDSIFSNVFIDEHKYTMIDYEWVIHEAVPIKYFYFRCLFWFLNDNPNRKELLQMDLFHYFKFSKKEVEKYSNMENDFQTYVRGNKIPLWKIEEKMNQNKYHMDKFVEYEIISKKKRLMKVYFDYGEGFSEDNSIVYSSDINYENRKIKISIPENCIAIRLDPSEYASIIGVVKAYFISDNSEIKEIQFSEESINGKKLDNRLFVFYTDDPQIIMQPKSNDIQMVIELSVNELSEENCEKFNITYDLFKQIKGRAKELGELNDIQKEYIDKLNTLCNEKDEYSKKLELICREKDDYIKNMESLCIEKDTYSGKLVKLCEEKDQEYSLLLNNMENLNVKTTILETEMDSIKKTFWFRLIMKVKRIIGRG